METNLESLEFHLNMAKIYAGERFEKLGNSKQFMEAIIFERIRDSLAENLQTLYSYLSITKEERKTND